MRLFGEKEKPTWQIYRRRKKRGKREQITRP
jgi:hypothetical protein